MAAALGGVVRGIALHAFHATTDAALVGAEARLLVALAGHEAEVAFLGSADPRHSLGDFAAAHGAAMQLVAAGEHARLGTSETASHPALTSSALPLVRRAAERHVAALTERWAARASERVKLAEVEARRLVRAHGVAVAHLAAGLERFRTLSASEVRDIVAEGMRRQSVSDHGWTSRL